MAMGKLSWYGSLRKVRGYVGYSFQENERVCAMGKYSSLCFISFIIKCSRNKVCIFFFLGGGGGGGGGLVI